MGKRQKRYILGITGATGSIYGYRVLQELLAAAYEVHLIVTDTGKMVMEYELEKSLDELLGTLSSSKLHLEGSKNFFSKVASGSCHTDGMIIAPCSMGTLGKMAAGTSDHLMIRAADVCLKEKRPLVLMTRETPLSAIHLENMQKLNRAGAFIMPPVPSFYNKPVTVDDIIDQSVARALGCLQIQSPLLKEWTH